MKASELPYGHIGKSNIGDAVIIICGDKQAVFLNQDNVGGLYYADNLSDDYEDMGPFYVDFKEEIKYVPVLKNLGD